jgi:hypothetical protein
MDRQGWETTSALTVEMKGGLKDKETKGKEKKGKETTGKETTGKQRKGKDTAGRKEKKGRKVLGPKLPDNGQHATSTEAAATIGAEVTGKGLV